ncbi:Uncharacterised protein [Bordetella pertussis]|nr:Uncharacterised protein [Bordetella pertussis]CFP59777.1 Uncharacterised protein [Bordetella pertussis]CFU79622.1 Uncharacterised protein [Bordetella pertussis]CPH69356.1 Uncharacterised protein [Bordetella pertussis]CPN17194.1 Uncharacterised protein [Bordetella pertussis]
MESWPEMRLINDAGTKNGEMRRGPLANISVWVSSMRGRPPMPDPTITPMRSALVSVTSRPQSRHACMPAARP